MLRDKATTTRLNYRHDTQTSLTWNGLATKFCLLSSIMIQSL